MAPRAKAVANLLLPALVGLVVGGVRQVVKSRRRRAVLHLRRTPFVGFVDDHMARLETLSKNREAAGFLRQQALGQLGLLEQRYIQAGKSAPTESELYGALSPGARAVVRTSQLLFNHDGVIKQITLEDRYCDELTSIARQLSMVAVEVYEVAEFTPVVSVCPRPTSTVSARWFENERSLAIAYPWDLREFISYFDDLLSRDHISASSLRRIIRDLDIVSEPDVANLVILAQVRFFAVQERLVDMAGFLWPQRGDPVNWPLLKLWSGQLRCNAMDAFVLAHEIAHVLLFERPDLRLPDSRLEAAIARQVKSPEWSDIDQNQVEAHLRSIDWRRWFDEIDADIIALRLLSEYLSNRGIALGAAVAALTAVHVVSTAAFARLPASHPPPIHRAQLLLDVQTRLPKLAVDIRRCLYLGSATSFVPPLPREWQILHEAVRRKIFKGNTETHGALDMAAMADLAFGGWRPIRDPLGDDGEMQRERLITGIADLAREIDRPVLKDALGIALLGTDDRSGQFLDMFADLLPLSSGESDWLRSPDAVTYKMLIDVLTKGVAAASVNHDSEADDVAALFLAGLFADICKRDYWRSVAWV